MNAAQTRCTRASDERWRRGHLPSQARLLGHVALEQALRELLQGKGSRGIAIDLDGSLPVAGSGLARLDANGAAIWTLPIAAPVSGLAVSPLGTIAITGAAPAALDLGAGPIAPTPAGSDAFVATFDPEGDPGGAPRSLSAPIAASSTRTAGP